MSLPATDPNTRQVIDAVRAALPSQGLFAEKEWLLSPLPFALSKKDVRELESLGQRLLLFQKACNNLYLRSTKGSLPGYIAEYLDAGKPGALVAHSRHKTVREELPRVIRPDLILTEDGFKLTELDSVPGGIGLTAWLHRTYASLGSQSLVGGAEGMLDGFRGIFPGGADIVVSEESSGYRPEMEWLAAQLNSEGKGSDAPSWKVHKAEEYRPAEKPVYRFFELFDLDNIPFAAEATASIEKDALRISPPLKPFLEEKLWLALFWLQPLRETWRRELRDSNFRKLAEIIPYSWVMDPAPLPHHGVIPRLDINRMAELASFSQKKRDLVLKISGFSEKAWGSRGVHIGADMPQDEWGAAVEGALAGWKSHPYLLQEFHKAKRVRHPYWNEETQSIEMLDARVRLCPYYFNRAGADGSLGDKVVLGGVLATIVPADKKLLHGMRDAILVPCCLAD